MFGIRNHIVRLAALVITLLLLMTGAEFVTHADFADLVMRFFLPLQSCTHLIIDGPQSCHDIINTYFVLLLSALAFAVPYKVRFFNVGVEGQSLGGSALLFLTLYLLGGVFSGLGTTVGTSVALLIAALGGTAVGFVPFLLWRFLNINGVVSTLITNLVVAAIVVDVLATTGLMDKSNAGVQSTSLPPSLLSEIRHPVLFGLIEAPVFWALCFVLFCTLVVFWFTRVGLFSDAIGSNERAARVIGLSTNRLRVIAVFAGTALGGLVGVLYTLEHGRITLDYFTNIGFEGLGVAVFGGYRPVGMLVSGIFITLWRLFGNELQMLGAPAEFALGGFGAFILLAVIFEAVGKRWTSKR